MIRLAHVILILGTLSASTSRAASQCAHIFPKPTMTAETQKSISKSILSLAQLKITLDRAQINNKQSIEFTALINDYKNKERELATYLEANGFSNHQDLIAQVKIKISGIQSEIKNKKTSESDRKEKSNRERQEKKIRDMHVDGTEAVFRPIKPGSFRMGEPGKQVLVTIEKPFQMMATPTTIFIFNSVLALAKERFPGEYDILKNFTELGPAVPVHYVAYVRAQTWINVLNRLSNEGVPELEQVIRDHRTGDKYRLPTEEEWEFVVRGRGKYDGLVHFDKDLDTLDDFAWNVHNSAFKPQPVAQKKPVIIDGLTIYDMYGNVNEWVQHKVYDGLNDTRVSPAAEDYVLRGGGAGTDSAVISSSFRMESTRDNNSRIAGFRLVREVRP